MTEYEARGELTSGQSALRGIFKTFTLEKCFQDAEFIRHIRTAASALDAFGDAMRTAFTPAQWKHIRRQHRRLHEAKCGGWRQ